MSSVEESKSPEPEQCSSFKLVKESLENLALQVREDPNTRYRRPAEQQVEDEIASFGRWLEWMRNNPQYREAIHGDCVTFPLTYIGHISPLQTDIWDKLLGVFKIKTPDDKKLREILELADREHLQQAMEATQELLGHIPPLPDGTKRRSHNYGDLITLNFPCVDVKGVKLTVRHALSPPGLSPLVYGADFDLGFNKSLFTQTAP